MHELYVGVAHVTLLLRHARSLKDKRNILKSIEQKLKNLGFSVTESGYQDEPKRASVGFAFVGRHAPFVERTLEEGLRLFVGVEVVQTDKDIFDYSDSKYEEEYSDG